MTKIEELLEMWRKDCDIDRTEPGKALLDIPKLHSKYLTILSKHRLLSKEAEFKYNKMKRLKWEYYTGKLDDDQLKQYGWEPFLLNNTVYAPELANPARLAELVTRKVIVLFV